MVPGDTREGYTQTEQARQILADAEEDLEHWEPSLEPIHTAGGELGANLMPGRAAEATDGGPRAEGAEGQEASRSSYQKEQHEGSGGVNTMKDTVMQAAPSAA